MSAEEIVVGLDIGTTKIAVMVGRKDDSGKIEILGYGQTESIGVMRGSVINVDKTAESIKIAKEAAELLSGVEIHEVYVGIAGQHIKSRQHRGSVIREHQEEEITKDEVIRLIRNMEKVQVDPGEKIIHVIPQEFIVDGVHGINQEDVVGMSGVSLEANFHIITGHFAAIKNIRRSVEKAGLDIAALVLEPLVSAEAVLDDRDKEAGVVLVDIGGGTTDMAIFQDRVLCHTAVIPLAGNIITQDIKDGCSIIKLQAEALKVRFGSALASENKAEEIISIPGLRGRAPKEISLKNLANIIGARMSEIIEHVQFEIKNSGYENKLIGGIVLTGGGAKLQHVVQLTEYVTGMDTRIGLPNEHLVGKYAKELSDPMFATGVGLVIQGLVREEEKAYESSTQMPAKSDVVQEAPKSEIEVSLPPKKESTPIMSKWKGFGLRKTVLDFLNEEDE